MQKKIKILRWNKINKLNQDLNIIDSSQNHTGHV